ncbi:MAG: glycosyltransferase family 2 protein [Hungatella sp.]|jgi:glycosyltransferase involved in cell wall biosynthesis|nr:glycosyltransferase family 2 protein [Hungatella sp.]
MSEIVITIFTPTYNRSHLITNLYDSLTQQTYKNFEWLVIDNGTDNTHDIIENLKQKKTDFPIIYHKTSNSSERGINRAMNKAVKMASGHLFMKVDDDDILTSDALEKIILWESTILPEEKKSFAGVSGLRAHKDGTIIGGYGKGENIYIDATNLQRNKFRLEGDKAEAYYTNVLISYGPLPEIDGEYYTWEGMLYDRIAAAGLKIRWFKDIIYYTEYLPGGATSQVYKACEENFKTYTLLISERIGFKDADLIYKLKGLRRLFKTARKLGLSYSDVKSSFNCSRLFLFGGYCLSIIT